MKLGKLSWSTLALSYLAACATTTTDIKRRSDMDTASYNVEVISHSSLSIPEPEDKDIAQQARSILNYLDFEEKYRSKTEDIVRTLAKKEFSPVETKVRQLAQELESDPNPYAGLQLERVKNFSYTIYEVKQQDTNTKQRQPRSSADAVLSPIPFAQALLCDLLGIKAFPEHKSNVEAIAKIGYPEKTIKTESAYTADEYKVIPYSGQKIFVQSKIINTK